MRTTSALLILLALLAGRPAVGQEWWESATQKGGGKVDALRVDAAIALGTEYLKKRQKKDGSFPGHQRGYPMGMTALCLLTLLKCGVPSNDPAVIRAVDHLRYLRFKKTYSTGCLLMALEALRNPEHKPWVEAGVKFLLDTRHAKNGGQWSYPNNDWDKTEVGLGRPDLSNTQYAILGLRAAKRLGVKVSARAFTEIAAYLTEAQLKGGGFRYRGGYAITGSMSTAALAILAIAREQVGRTERFKRIKREVDETQKKGMAWFDRRFLVEWNPRGNGDGRDKHRMAYYLYGVERLCDIVGLKKLGGLSWYDEGAKFLLANQRKNGAWNERDSLQQTCFALLFLTRATLSIDKEIRTTAVAARKVELGVLDRGRAARAKRPRGRDVSFIREWLLCGRFDVKGGNALDLEEHPAPPTNPVGGAVFRTGRWKIYKSPADKIDFKQFYTKRTQALVYAATYLHVPRKTEALLWLTTPNHWRVWLNGKAVGELAAAGVKGKDRWRLPVTLKKGVNSVCLLIESWDFHFRVSGTDTWAIHGFMTSTGKNELVRRARKKPAPFKFVGRDVETGGNWAKVRGAKAWWIPTAKRKAQNGFRLAVASEGSYTWQKESTDARAPSLSRQEPDKRRAADWHDSRRAVFIVDTKPRKRYRLSIYVLDFDHKNRAAEVRLVGAHGVLDTRKVSAAEADAGIYLTWDVIGPKRIEVLRSSGPNVCVSGVFIDAVPRN